MNDQGNRGKWLAVVGYILTLILTWGNGIAAGASTNQIPHLSIPILGTSMSEHYRPVGVICQIFIDLRERQDHNGLQIQFHIEPGQFSLLARKAIHHAISQAFELANLPSNSWTVRLRVPYPDLTIYGESLSAMVALSVVAMAKGDPILEGRALTGTITNQGSIGAVGGLQLKILAAYYQHFQRVLIPGEYDTREDDWRTPFLMHVSPVTTIEEAYLGLTGHHLLSHS